MGKNWSYVSGDWWIICDVCSQKVKASKTRERWDGFRVCKGCWEPRHSLDFIRARNDRISVPFTRPQPADQFVPYGVGIHDSFTFTDLDTEYVEPSYFAEDYIGGDAFLIEAQYVRDFTDTVSFIDPLSFDSISFTESGIIDLPLYIDVTYFASDFMLTIQTF